LVQYHHITVHEYTVELFNDKSPNKEL